MGIKHFFYWFRNKFEKSIKNIKNNESPDIQVDNLLIDMNGIFHTSAQKIYKYGNFKEKESLLKKITTPKESQDNLIFKDVCSSLDEILLLAPPKKRVVLCVDGPAPLSKMVQQRSRRFMSAKNSENLEFDSNCISPGTKFMDSLCKYIDIYIRKRLSSPIKTVWSDLEIIFSNEKAPGEGEHLLMAFVRKHIEKDPANAQESYCLHGMDADLIMIALATHLENFWILRENQFDEEFSHSVIHIGEVRKELVEAMRWEGVFSPKKCINDFIVMCFLMGNDFLPNVPALEIIEGGIDFAIEIYKNVGESYGHLTKKTQKGNRFNKKTLSVFLGGLSKYEKIVLETKAEKTFKFFPDVILTNSTSNTPQGKIVNIFKYRKEYYEKKLTGVKVSSICHSYLEGMQWVLDYYTQGVTNWSWQYPYHYAPFCYDLAKYVKIFSHKNFEKNAPVDPFLQLLHILPPKSRNLIPSPLCDLFNTVLKDSSPEEFKTDLSGKRKEWEATVLLPMIDDNILIPEYIKGLEEVDDKDKKRNVLGKAFLYKKTTPYKIGNTEFLYKPVYVEF